MDEPTPPSGKGDGPVEGWAAPQNWVAPPGRGSDSLLVRVAKVIAVVAVVVLISAFTFGFVYGFLADPDAPVVLPWEAAPAPVSTATDKWQEFISHVAVTANDVGSAMDFDSIDTSDSDAVISQALELERLVDDSG